MIQEQLAFLPEFLSDYRPFPPAKERTAWQGLPLRAKQRFLQAGEAALQTPIAPLPLSLWLQKFEAKMHDGTNAVADYSSKFTVIDGDEKVS